MRPRKTIFVIDHDEARRQQLCFALELRLRCRAFSAAPWGEPEPLWDGDGPGALRADVAILRTEQPDTVCRSLQRSTPGIRVLILSRKPEDAGTAQRWLRDDAPVEEVLDRVRILMPSRRGPQKPVVTVLAPEERSEARTA